MKDLFGKWRGSCQTKGCDCEDYSVEGSGRQCDYCTHDYDQHCIIGACQKCTGEESCDGYEHDEGEEDPACSYCGHFIHEHKIIRSTLPTCKLPGCNRPCYKEANGHVYDFCGRTHASAYQRGASNKPVCSFPGCPFPRYVDEQGSTHECCSRKCAAKYAELKSRSVPMRQASGTISKATVGDESIVIKHFLDTWTKGVKPPRSAVKAVYKIQNDPMEKDYRQYCGSLGQANTGYFYHGTTLNCPILESGRLCSDASCGVCGISHLGFLPQKLGQHVGRFQRFGLAFYFAVNSSKCHEYTVGHKVYRALLLCEVAQGKRYMAKSNMKDLTQPPQGHNSVYGQPGIHKVERGSLNYAEVAVYNCSAILPKFIIIYEKDGTQLLLR